MEMITKGKIRTIYGMASLLGLVDRSGSKDDNLHQLVESRTGKDSIAALTSDEADTIIGELKHMQRFGNGHPSVKKARPGGVSPGQQRKIIALVCELRKLDKKKNDTTVEARVAGIIRRELKITAVAADPYIWLSYQDGVKLIEVIKGYLESARRKAKRSDAG